MITKVLILFFLFIVSSLLGDLFSLCVTISFVASKKGPGSFLCTMRGYSEFLGPAFGCASTNFSPFSIVERLTSSGHFFVDRLLKMLLGVRGGSFLGRSGLLPMWYTGSSVSGSRL